MPLVMEFKKTVILIKKLIKGRPGILLCLIPFKTRYFGNLTH
jgi:hypothetical protein